MYVAPRIQKKKSTQHCASFCWLVVQDAGTCLLFLRWCLRNFTELVGLWIFMGFITQSFYLSCLTKASKELVISRSSETMNIILTNVVEKSEVIWNVKTITVEDTRIESKKINRALRKESILLVLPLRSKLLFVWFLQFNMKGKSIFQANSCIPMLICFSKRHHTWSNGSNWRQHLIKCMIIHGHSPRSTPLLQSPNDQIRDLICFIKHASSESLIVAIIPEISAEIYCTAFVYHSGRKGKFYGYPFDSS